ncbi:unnamed protein product [Triticum turgidum subsp. durum]|uniref:Uncharacterized protein n=1 Tax=Triticum turgidum subsp. durum TaxID=4567 RepID=A0A9R0Y6I2_TRITD|nr:unnamed protein product [Triticum turgidum subsp. durum]
MQGPEVVWSSTANLDALGSLKMGTPPEHCRKRPQRMASVLAVAGYVYCVRTLPQSADCELSVLASSLDSNRFPGAVVEYTSGEEDEEEEEEEEQAGRAGKETDRRHGDALAKWFMVLEEGKRAPRKNQEHELPHEEQEKEDAAPPANALMLMRCRSAPAKGLARRLGVADAGEDEEEAESESNKAREEEPEKENLVVMRYPPDFFQVSMDIAKETWIVGGDDSVLRCRSWKK